MQKVYIKFPKTGLGNMMLVWARGVVFAHLNNLPYTTSSWRGLRLGALIRWEKKKRLYLGYFIETPYLKKFQIGYKYWFAKVQIEPPVQIISKNNTADLFVFKEVITDNDLFGALRTHKDLILHELDKIISPRIKAMLLHYQPPVIGVHIRRGDFKIGNPITPNEFFIKGINLIRTVVGNNWPVTIFTDADKNEIKDILGLPEIYMAEEKSDIADILLLSKSKIMLLSQSSTFSYWGAFLSDAIVVRPVNDWQVKIRDITPDSIYQEIKWDCNSELSTIELARKIKLINN
jgi:hypothetical protein